MSKDYNRRDVLKLTGKGALGIAALGVLPAVLTACDNGDGAAASSEDVKPITGPYTYEQLDVEKVATRGHDGYYNVGNCCSGAADALLGELSDNVGYPFNQIPVDAFQNGGGGYGVGTLCGSLGAATFLIGLVAEPDDAKKLTQELYKWYRETPLPQYEGEMELVQTVSGSVNCDESVGYFIEEADSKFGSDEQRERCACITADVSKKTAELLNDFFA